MPAFKLTKELFIKDKLSNNIVHSIHSMPKDDDLKSDLLQILNVENAKDQIEVLKKVSKEISNRIKNNADNEDVVLALNYLVHIFFISTSKNPCRRVLISIFQGLPENVRSKVIGPAFKHALHELCNHPIKISDSESDGPIRFVDTVDLRHNVDTIAAVIENFPLGEDCVSKVCLESLTYLGKLQDNFFYSYGDWLSPVQQNEVMHHCLETVKLANRICQKSSVALETKLKDEVLLETYRQVVTQFISIDIKILQTDDFLLDCKTTSAMNIWLMLKFCLDRDQLISQASKTMFKHIDWLLLSFKQIDRSPYWLQELNFDHLTRSNLSSSAYLCSVYGFLAMVAMETLFLPVDGKCLILDVLLQEFLELSKSSSDVGSKLLAAKSVCFLTQKVRDYCSQGNIIPVEIEKRLLGDSENMKAVLQFVWTAWEDSVDAIRFTVKDVFENVVAIHVHLKSNTVSAKDDPLLHHVALSILNDVSWSCKGKYPTLSVLVSHLGSTSMLMLHPGIAGEILEQMQEQTLACYASGLYEKMFISHRAELTNDQSESSTWFQQWLEPILTVLCGNNVLQKKHIIEYILPKLLKTGTTTLHYIIQRLSIMSGDNTTHQSTGNLPCTHTENKGLYDLTTDFLNFDYSHSLLKTRFLYLIELIIILQCTLSASIFIGQAWHYITYMLHMVGNEYKQIMCMNIVGGEIGALVICLCRARALGLLKTGSCGSDGGSTGELWCGVVDVNLLKQALICNDDQIRLDAFALLCENQKTSETISMTELQLITYFIPQNLNNQNPAFRQHFLSLLKKFVSRMKESSVALKRKVSKDKTAAGNLRQYKMFLEQLTRLMFSQLYPGSVFARRTTSLGALVLLKETFGGHNNGCEKEYSFYDCEENVVKELLDISLSLSESTRPQDSTTAAYLLSVLTHQHNMHTVLTQHIQTSQSEDLKCDLETEALKSDNGKECIDETNVIKSENDREVLREGKNKKSLVNVRGGDSELVRRYILLEILMKNLQIQTETAKSSLIVAAANKPLYPTIQCMRYCFADIQYRNIPSECVVDWRNLVARFIALCFEISGVVSPVVCNSSPEGNVPVDAVTGIENLEDGDSENVSKSKETVMLMPEYLIVCCWRSVKEISLLLGQLTSDLPIVSVDTHQGLLTYEQVVQVGEFFTTLLLESKHRGAFELAYTGFVKVTDMLWRSSDADLHHLPKKWLSEVMVDIKSNDPESRLCATRRSAGVPFYVQALVTTEPSSTGRQCFRQTMQELLTLAFDETIITQEKCTAKVHALNILRAMYKDSRLRDDVAPYLADGLKVAILGFKSPLWAVRNSATLLMTAMMTRIFGVKRSKDETTFSRKNCQTGRTFFYNYPSLYQFLLEQIAMATEHVTSQLHPGLFPILMVLGRLFPSAMEGTDTSLNLAAFIPYVVKCSANPVLKTREMAAKALQPLVEKDQVTSVFHDLLTLLPHQQTDVMRQNQIHGVLLQISQLCRTIPLLPDSIQYRLSSVIHDMWTDRMCILMSRHNRCLATRTVALNITFNFVQHFGDKDIFVSSLSDIVSTEVLSLDTAYDPCTPALSEFQATICKLYCEIYLSVHNERHGPDSVSETVDNGIEASGKFTESEDSYRSSKEETDGGKLQSSVGQGDGKVLQIDEVKNVILKCLKSNSYEVRKEVLSQLGNMMSEIREDCGSENFAESSNITENSKVLPVKIIPQLLGMLVTEIHEECKIEILGLLEKSLGHCDISDSIILTLMQSVQVITNQLQLQTCSDKLTAAAITFTGMAISQLSRMFTNGPNNQTTASKVILEQDHEDKHHVSMATHVVLFVDIIRGYTEQMETSCDILLACAKALLQNVDILLGTDTQTCLKNTDDVFKSVLDLLQTDDIEVRETAAAIVYSMSSQQINAYGHPYIAIKDLLENCVSQGKLSDGRQDFIKLLFDMMLEDKDDSQEYEERLFDRGEMNTYWDELDFIQVIQIVYVTSVFDIFLANKNIISFCLDCKKYQFSSLTKKKCFNPKTLDLNILKPMLESAIMKYVQCDSVCQSSMIKPAVVLESGPGHNEHIHQSEHWSIIRSAVKDYFHSGHVITSDHRQLETDATELTFQNIFFNTSSYQKHVLSLYRTLIMIKYGKLLSSNCDENVTRVVENTVVMLKDTTDKYIWLPVLYDSLIKL
ncbi:tRNA (32-2'-O)-methyltransferase regulator THADA-like [Ruditapes philippinarum]|uniref:tRNA (32-2'-O)-methyltransferase regulator THADA-like n=1 Tax=Ruditapes philippinarum TaxID=129788 RepID=UPI00295B4762|nr:tRNA (32-2'-O)-methyltransferase regulator THADA-like [Ruditapes philippinarum]